MKVEEEGSGRATGREQDDLGPILPSSLVGWVIFENKAWSPQNPTSPASQSEAALEEGKGQSRVQEGRVLR